MPISRNAVAPDWNLKNVIDATTYYEYVNAVAPDWNLKEMKLLYDSIKEDNAVAPDWNLKQVFSRRFKAVKVMQSHQIGI